MNDIKVEVEDDWSLGLSLSLILSEFISVVGTNVWLGVKVGGVVVVC